MRPHSLFWLALLALPACKANIQLELDPDPAEEEGLIRTLDRIQVVVHGAGAALAQASDGGQGSGAPGADLDGDGVEEPAFTEPVRGWLPILEFEISKSGGRDLQFRVLGYDAGGAVIAYGGAETTAPRSGGRRVGIPFRLLAQARPPQVVNVLPADGASVPRNLAGVVVYFSTTVDPATLAAVRLSGPSGDVPVVPSLETIQSEGGPFPQERSKLILWLTGPVALEYRSNSAYQLQIGPGLRSLAGLAFDQKPGTPEPDPFTARFTVDPVGLLTNACQCPLGYFCSNDPTRECMPAGGCDQGCKAGFVCHPERRECVEDCRPHALCVRAAQSCDPDTGLCSEDPPPDLASDDPGASLGHLFFTGDFDGDGRTDVAFHQVSDDTWWYGLSREGEMEWLEAPPASLVPWWDPLTGGETQAWSGNFKGTGRTDLLLYDDPSGSWIRGELWSRKLDWSEGANTHGADGRGVNFGALLHRPHAIWIGAFSRPGFDDVLVYDDLYGDWWLGTFSASIGRINWRRMTPGSMGSTFSGRALDLSPTFWTGDFDGNGRTEILYNRYMGAYDDSAIPARLAWTPFTHVARVEGAFPDLDPSPQRSRIWPADLDGDGKTDLLFHDDRDGSWWLGHFTGAGFSWGVAGSTRAADGAPIPLLDAGHRVWTGRFSGGERAEVLVYSEASGDWQLGTWDGSSIGWTPAGNSRGAEVDLGPLLDGSRLIWTGDFTGEHRTSLLVYSSQDGAWWRGAFAGGRLGWQRVSSRPDLGDLTR